MDTFYLIVIISIFVISIIVALWRLSRRSLLQKQAEQKKGLLEDVCIEYFCAKNRKEALKLVSKNKIILLSDEAQTSFSIFRGVIESKKDFHLLYLLDEMRWWLIRCRDIGIDATKKDVPDLSYGEALETVHIIMNLVDENAEWVEGGVHLYQAKFLSPKSLDLIYSYMAEADAKGNQEMLDRMHKVHMLFVTEYQKSCVSEEWKEEVVMKIEQTPVIERIKIAKLYQERGELELEKKHFDRAEELLGLALKGFVELEYRKQMISVNNQLGFLYLDQEKYQNAAGSFATSLKLSNEINSLMKAQIAARQLSVCQMKMGNFSAAKRTLSDARRLSELGAEQAETYKNLLKLVTLAELSGDEKALEEALEELGPFPEDYESNVSVP